MATPGAIFGPVALRLLRVAVAKTTKAVRLRLADATRHAQHAVKSGHTARQPVHPTAFLKQQRRGARWFSGASASHFSGALRRFISHDAGASRPSLGRSKSPTSHTSRLVAQSSSRAPFASALRPNLTGGALPRSAGGYGIGGSARYFSHTPAAPAQVVQNVSQAMRAFFLSGKRLRYDGVGPHGNAKYRTVTPAEHEATRRLAETTCAAPGAFIDFVVNPTITAVSPLAAAVACASSTSGFDAAKSAAIPTTLQTEGLLDVLSDDFGRALRDLRAVYADLGRLSALGELPVSLEEKGTLRVRFPGVDGRTVERLCNDLGIQRGVVGEDAEFDVAVGAPVVLRLPFAPDADGGLESPGISTRSMEGHEAEDCSSLGDDSFLHAAFAADVEDHPWLSEPEGYESVSQPASSGEFEGFEGIHRFLEECDRGKGRLG